MNPDKPFDYWLFSTTWAPHFCCLNARVCNSEQMAGQNAFLPHGLWPSYRDKVMVHDKQGKSIPSYYPTYCKIDNASASASPSVGSLRGRRKHEWHKHGTCSSLSSAAYFAAEAAAAAAPQLQALQDYLQGIVTKQMQAAKASTSGAVAPGHGSEAGKKPATVSVRAVQAMLGGADKVAIKASKHCVLQELTTCLARNGQSGSPIGLPQECPAHVLSSERNSAISVHGCQHLVLDNAHATSAGGTGSDNDGTTRQCAFVTQALLRELKGTGGTPSSK